MCENAKNDASSAAKALFSEIGVVFRSVCSCCSVGVSGRAIAVKSNEKCLILPENKPKIG